MSSIEFPRTDDVCARLAFGTGRLHQRDLANMEATVRRAYDLGIRHFDSSVGYVNAAPHAAIARLLRDVPADDLFISTKIGHIRQTFPNHRELYRDAGALWGIVHECHRMLNGKIDLLQMHEADLDYWWETGDPKGDTRYLLGDHAYDFSDAAGLDVLRRAKSSGVCRYTGVTGNSAGPLTRVIDTIEVDSVMCAYNLDPILRGTLDLVEPVARRKGLLLMAAGMLQGGSFRRPLDLPERYRVAPRLVAGFAAFDRIRADSGLSAVELVLRWSLSVRSVDRWILGASQPAQVEETMAILRKGPLPSDLDEALDALAVHGLDWSTLWAHHR